MGNAEVQEERMPSWVCWMGFIPCWVQVSTRGRLAPALFVPDWWVYSVRDLSAS